MEKEELIEILAKSILNCIDSKLLDLKRSISEDQEDCVRSVVKKVKQDQSCRYVLDDGIGGTPDFVACHVKKLVAFVVPIWKWRVSL